MICGHCSEEGVNKSHVLECSRRQPSAQTHRPKSNKEAKADRHHADRRELFQRVREAGARIEEGYYAVPTEDGGLAFYRVNKGQGVWAGRAFISQQVSDGYRRLSGLKVELAVLTKILANPQAAMLAYGREIGRCGHCNRALTDEESRQQGIGPICARKLGWISTEALAG